MERSETVEAMRNKSFANGIKHILQCGVGLCFGLVAAIGLNGCGGSSSVTGGGADFAISAATGSAAVTQGQATALSFTLSAKSSLGAVVQLSISGLPAGASSTFPDGSTVSAPDTVSIGILTSTVTQVGVFRLTITGSDFSGNQSTTVTLTINPAPAPPDFNMTVSLGDLEVNAGGAPTGTVNVSPFGASPGTVNLSATGAPAGVTVSFSPSSVPAANGASTVTITTDASAPNGQFQIGIVGSDSSGSETLTVFLTIVPGNPSAGFFLSVSPPATTVDAGGTANYTVNVLPSGGNPIPSTSFSVANLPGGASAQVNQSGPGVFVVSIFTDPNSNSTGSNPAITGTGPDGRQTLSVALGINLPSN